MSERTKVFIARNAIFVAFGGAFVCRWNFLLGTLITFVASVGATIVIFLPEKP